MVGKFHDIKTLFHQIVSLPLLDERYGIIFVYNTSQTMSDTFHETECILSEELHMIMSSFQRVAKCVYPIDGEEKFMETIHNYRAKHEYLLVYSMAQNLKGNGRRSLIPLLCDYYNLINIGADFMSCALGRSKDIMYQILKPKGFLFPETYYIYKAEDIDNILSKIQQGRWLLKPNNESSSIGLQVYDFSNYTAEKIKSLIIQYQQLHNVFCIQKFICGDEVAVPILKIKDLYYSPGVSQVKFPPGTDYINYDMITLETYGYSEYVGKLKSELIAIAVNVSKELHLTAMSRIDFRIRNGVPYIEDIGANPTVSEANGVNQLYCKYLTSEPWCIYAILVYSALINSSLFEPSFHQTPDNRCD